MKGQNIMDKITVNDIITATGGKLICGSKDAYAQNVSIDSREVTNNTLFVALKGENSDGHNYIEKAFENGASLVISEKDIMGNGAVVKVDNSSKALGQIAKFYKKKLNLKTIAVTGSVGKTTTKDMLSAVMNMQYNTLKTEGNFNNELGLPLTILRLKKTHEAAVLEMGMSEFGEIDYLADIARPDVSIITNIGMSHIENLGSQEGIFKAKTEICNYFNKESLLIVNADDKYLQKALNFKGFSVVGYGIENDCQYKARDIENLGLEGTRFSVDIYEREYHIHVKTPGVHNVYNALAAIACGVHYNIGPNKIIEGIENFSLTKMRMSVEKAGNVTIINDCYNSSPDSVNAALKVLSTQDTRKVAVLGDILEMGEFAKDAHYKIGEWVAENKIDVLLTAGENAKFIAEGTKNSDIYSFDTTDELVLNISKFIKENDTVLVKASRGMHFEKVVEKITEDNK